MKRLFVCIIILTVSVLLWAEEKDYVRVSLQKFEQLLEAARKQPPPPPKPDTEPPIDYSLVSGAYEVAVAETCADIHATVELQVLTNEWVKIPLLAGDAAIAKVLLDGKTTTLKHQDNRYWLHIKAKGKHKLEIFYSIEVQRLVGGFRLQFSTPYTMAGTLQASLPGKGWTVHVLPAAGLKCTEQDGKTRISTTLLSTDRVQLLWGHSGTDSFAFSKGEYTVKAQGDGVFVSARYRVDVDCEQPLDIPVVPVEYGLQAISVDGKEQAIVSCGNMFGVRLRGHGSHTVVVRYAVNVDRSEGQPALRLRVPPSPIARFEFTVPGKRKISVFPNVPVVEKANDKQTTITVNFPRSETVRFAWSDSRPVPEQLVRTNGEGYYAVTADEGVLRINSFFYFEVISGKTRQLSFHVPDNVVIYQVVGDGVADWRTTKGEGGSRSLQVYLDKPRHGKYQLRITYDQLIPKSVKKQVAGVSIPIMQPDPIHRYQGTILLLSGEVFDFIPKRGQGYAPVGEEVIPADIKSQLDKKVAHGFKFVGKPTALVTDLAVPQKEKARYDSYVNSLHTLEEGLLRSKNSVDVTIKSGLLKELTFVLPKEVTVLDLISPHLLKHSENQEKDNKKLYVQFTQALDGTLRIDLLLERILDPQSQQVQLPAIQVLGAEVERGNIGVESLTTIEVTSDKLDDIQEIDPIELPRWLTERTANPILLAYKYSHQPYSLAVKIIRHTPVAPLEAQVTRAHLASTFQQDGNTVTEATYTITNHTKQFLRIRMPEQATLWQIMVNGTAVKAARDVEDRLIVPLPRSDKDISCSLRYSQKKAAMGLLGKIRLQAPKTELYTSTINWQVHLPTGFAYFMAGSNMQTLTRQSSSYALTKALTNVADAPLYFSVRYRSAGGALWGNVAVCLLCLLLLWLFHKRPRRPGLVKRVVFVALLTLLVFIVILLRPSAWLLGGMLALYAAYAYLSVARAAGRQGTNQPDQA